MAYLTVRGRLLLASLCPVLLLQAAALCFRYDFSIPGVLDRANLLYINDSFGAGDRISLTKMTDHSVGRVAHAQPVRLWDCRTGAAASFATSFSFAIGGNHNSTRGDGIAFFVGPFPPAIPWESGAQYLGLYTDPNLLGSPPTVAVEFDTFWNAGLDPQGVADHVGIDVSSIHSANWGRRSYAIVDVALTDPSCKTKPWAVTVMSAEGVCLLFAVIYIVINCCRRDNRRRLSVSRESSYQELPDVSTNADARISLPVPREFSYEELWEATDGFNKDSRFLGSGCFGEVYQGHLRHPSLPNPEVAVKKLNPVAGQCRKNYVSEIMIPGLLNHRNLVKLVGWCDGGADKQLLVYELVKNKSESKNVDEHLHGPGRLLAWPERYKIALGVGRAIEYLQTGCHNLIVLHRDIKPSNVLVDDDFEPKLGDFGLVRRVDPGQSSLGGTQMIGTKVYMDPICIPTGRVSTASDLYSFGVLLLEMATGRKLATVQDAMDLVGTVRECYNRGAVLQAADARLKGDFDREQMERVVAVGLLCVQQERQDRPEIASAVKLLSDLSRSLPDLGVGNKSRTNAPQQNS